MTNNLIKEKMMNSQINNYKNTNRVKKQQSEKTFMELDKNLMDMSVETDSKGNISGLGMTKKELKIAIFSKLRAVLEISRAANLKFFLITVVEFYQDSSYVNTMNHRLAGSLEELELSNFAILTSRISIKKNTHRSYALLGIRSVIGYNPNLITMIHEGLSNPHTAIDIKEMSNGGITLILENFQKLECDINYLLYYQAENYLYLYDEFDYLIEEHPNIHQIAYEVNEKTAKLLERNLVYNTLTNNSFDEVTVVLALTSYFQLVGKKADRKEIASYLKKQFPKQLKAIDLELLFNLYNERVEKVIKTWEE